MQSKRYNKKLHSFLHVVIISLQEDFYIFVEYFLGAADCRTPRKYGYELPSDDIFLFLVKGRLGSKTKKRITLRVCLLCMT